MRYESIHFYLFFGFLDRYFELTLEADQGNLWDLWDPLWRGTMFRRTGFTAHPKYLELVEIMGYMDIWEERGPPDFCEKIDGDWRCE